MHKVKNINSILRLTDVDKVMESINYRLDIPISFDDLVNMQSQFFYLYLTENFNIAPNRLSASRLFVDTGLKQSSDGRSICIGTYKASDDCFEGAFISTPDGLAIKLSKLKNIYIPENTVREIVDAIEYKTYIPENEKKEKKSSIDNSNSEEEKISPELKKVTTQISKRLLCNNFCQEKGLSRYLYIAGTRLYQLEKSQKDINCAIIEKSVSAILNTGLLDKYGKDILVMYKKNLKDECYVPFKIINSKSDALNEGFNKEIVCNLNKLKPIDFFNNKEDRFLLISYEDLDIDYAALEHIIQGRKYRFPESIEKLSPQLLAQKIENALKLSLTMQVRDNSYIKPSYSARIRGISWFIPLHIESDMLSEPELVIIIRKIDEFYEVKTVIPYDDCAKDKITALSLYDKIW